MSFPYEISYFGGIFNFDDFRVAGRVNVFDDFSEWKFVPNRRGWFGCQLRFTVNEKYKRKVTINNGGRPAIYLFNADTNPFHQMGADERQYYQETCVFIWLDQPLFTGL